MIRYERSDPEKTYPRCNFSFFALPTPEREKLREVSELSVCVIRMCDRRALKAR